MRRAWWSVAFLLTLPFLLGVPSAGAQGGADEPWVISDPAGDAGPFGIGVEGAPTTPASSTADLLEVRIEREDETGFFLVLVVEELRTGSVGMCCPSELRIVVDFALQGVDVNYRLDLNIYGGPNPDAGSLFVLDPSDAWGYLDLCGEGHCISQPFEFSLDDEANEVRLWIPKDSLLGLGDPDDLEDRPTELPDVLPAGSQLQEIRVTTELDTPFPIEDQAGGPDAAYTFKFGAANTLVRLLLPTDDRTLPVAVGANQSIPFHLTNTAAAKRLVQLTYAIEGNPDAMAKYKVSGPASVSVPGGSTRNFTFALEVDSGATAADDVRVVLRGVSYSHPDELAFASARLVPGAALGPTSNVIHFHGQHAAALGEPLDAAACANPTSLGFFFEPCDSGFLSPLADHPLASPTGRIQGDGDFWLGDFYQWFFLDFEGALPGPIAFSENGSVHVDLKFKAPLDASGVSMSAGLYYWGSDDLSGMLWDAYDSIQVNAAGTVLSFDQAVHLDGESYLPSGTDFGFYVLLFVPSTSPTAQAAWTAGGFELVADGSQIVLPLVELPEELRVDARPFPFQLSVSGDAEEFVNPGEARLFNVTVLNQAEVTERVQFSTQVEGVNWRAEAKPGSTFDLETGDTITLGVLVFAPEGAQEGETAVVRLNATDATGASRMVRLSAIVTSGVDLPDDSGSYRPDEDALAKQVKNEGGNTPGPGVLLVVVVVGSLALARRRRH